jgi:hypothetical protein
MACDPSKAIVPRSDVDQANASLVRKELKTYLLQTGRSAMPRSLRTAAAEARPRSPPYTAFASHPKIVSKEPSVKQDGESKQDPSFFALDDFIDSKIVLW